MSSNPRHRPLPGARLLGGLVLALGGALLAPGSVSAKDITLISKTSSNRGGAGTQTMWLTSDKMRTSDGATDILVDYATGEMTFIDLKKKSYWQTTPAEMNARFEELTKMLDSNPIMERLFGKGGEVEVTKKGSRELVGHSCDEYLISMGEAYEMSVCAAPDITPPVDVNQAKKLTFAMMGPMAGKIQKLFDEMSKLKGLPLASSVKMSLMGVNVETVQEATEISLDDISPATFQVPAGFKQKKSPFAK